MKQIIIMNYCSLVDNIFQNLGYMVLGGGVYVYKKEVLDGEKFGNYCPRV